MVKEPALLQKYLQQLTVLSRLRKLKRETVNQIKDMPIVYDIEKDGLYLEGMEKGVEKGIETGKIEICRRLLKRNLSYQEISDIVGLPVEK